MILRVRGRRFKLAWRFSGALCAIALALALVSARDGSFYGQGLRIAGPIRVDAFEGKWWIYNTTYPYMGSIVTVTFPGQPLPRWPRCTGFTALGVYFRHFTWPDHTEWTLAVAAFVPVSLAAGWLLAWWLAHRIGRRRGHVGVINLTRMRARDNRIRVK